MEVTIVVTMKYRTMMAEDVREEPGIEIGDEIVFVKEKMESTG